MITESPLQPSGIQILMATTSYPCDSADWKGRFVYEQAAALDRTGALRIHLWGPPGELPGQVSTANSTADAGRLQAMAERGGIAHVLRTHPILGLRQAREILSRLTRAARHHPVDLYHVNWLQLALGLPDDHRPVYISVLGSDFGLLRLPGMSSLLRRVFVRHPAVLAPNADWMCEKLASLFGDVASIRSNPFGVSPVWFDLARSPDAARQWLVVSRITRKKLGDLLNWGEGLFNDERRLVLLGPMQERVALPAWVDHRGSTDPRRLCEDWFPGSTGLLTLSQHDEGRPQVLIEAMAAGLPVIASRIPAHADLIHHGETGWLVDSRETLASALKQAETPEIANEIGAKARMWARGRIGTWDDYAQRCLTAYGDLLRPEERGHAV